MRIFGTVVLILALAVVSYSQQATDELTSVKNLETQVDNIVEPELKPIAINERPDATMIAAIVAVKKGNDLWRRGAIERSVASYEQAVELQPDLYAAQFNLGEAKLHVRQLPAATAAFEKAIALRPKSAEAWQGLGLTHYYQDHYQLAVDAFEHAQRLAPKDARINNNLGFAYLFRESWNEAIESFKTSLELNDKGNSAMAGLCAAYGLARLPEAVVTCLSAQKNSPASAVPRYFLGHAYLDKDDPVAAIKVFQEADRLEPHAPKIYLGLGFAYYKSRNYQRALYYFEQARQLNENAPDVYAGIGASYAELRKYDKAEAALREAVSRDPDHDVNHFNLGIVCLRRKNRDCAMGEYNYLMMNSDPLAKSLFSSIHGDKVIDATALRR